MQSPKFFKNPFTSTFCEMFNCTGKAEWLIGRPNEASLVMPGSIRMCDKCAANIVHNLPDALLTHVNVERALERLDLFPPTEPLEVLENLLKTVERKKIEKLLVKLEFSSTVSAPGRKKGK